VRRAVWLLAAAAAWAQEPPGPGHEHVDRRPMPRLTIEVEVVERKDRGPEGEVVRDLWFSGEADYPDGTRIAVDATLEGSDMVLPDRPTAPVQGKKWSMKERGTSMTIGRNAYKGTYAFRAEYSGDLQAAGWQRRLNPEMSAKNNYASVKVQIGSEEEIAKERAGVLQYYVRSWKAANGVADELEAEFFRQRKEFSKADWFTFKDDLLDRVRTKDRELSDFRILRDNVALPKVYSRISGTFASIEFLFNSLDAALPIGGATPPQDRVARATKLLSDLKAGLDGLQPELGQVQEDPAWKFPKKAPAPKGVQSKPPPDALPDPPPNRPRKEPATDPAAAPARFTALEVGIVFAVLCGVGLLVAVLRRK
jgi:hypothetical protein